MLELQVNNSLDHSVAHSFRYIFLIRIYRGEKQTIYSNFRSIHIIVFLEVEYSLSVVHRRNVLDNFDDVTLTAV